MTARISRSESASESVGSEVLDGAGVIGDAIGMTDNANYNHKAGTTPGATRFITGTITTEVEARAAELTATAAEVLPRTSPGNRPSNGDIGGRGEVYNRPGATTRPFNGDTQAARGYAEPRGQSGVRSGAFSGYDHGGEARSYSSRGSASFGGGGARGGGSWRRLVAAEARMAVAGIGNRVLLFLVVVRFRNGEKPYAANEAELRQILLRQSS